jgi:hypothetical protein
MVELLIVNEGEMASVSGERFLLEGRRVASRSSPPIPTESARELKLRAIIENDDSA